MQGPGGGRGIDRRLPLLDRELRGALARIPSDARARQHESSDDGHRDGTSDNPPAPAGDGCHGPPKAELSHRQLQPTVRGPRCGDRDGERCRGCHPPRRIHGQPRHEQHQHGPVPEIQTVGAFADPAQGGDVEAASEPGAGADGTRDGESGESGHERQSTARDEGVVGGHGQREGDERARGDGADQREGAR